MKNMINNISDLKKSLTESELEKFKVMKLVFRDFVVSYVICYVAIILYINKTMVDGMSLSYMMSALAPTVVVAAISKDIRMAALERSQAQ